MTETHASVAWQTGPALEPGWATTLPELIAQRARLLGDHPVVVDGGRAWSWPALLAQAAGVAAGFAACKPGDRVAIIAGNGAPHLLVELAVWMRGGVPVPVQPGLPEAVRAGILQAVAPVVVVEGDAAAAERCAVAPGVWDPRSVRPHDPALILATSGSSGRPRGVVLSHCNLCSQQAAFAQLWPEIGPGDTLVSYLPWHHSFGALAERLWACCRGATLHVVPGGGHDHDALLAAIARVRPSIFMSVPKIHHLVAAAGILEPQRVRWVFTAGAPLGPEAEAQYAQQGITVLEGWGLTECSPSATITRSGDERRPAVVGRPIPGVRVGVADDGRILVDGPGVMLGYWRDEAATAKVLDRGVLDSGDLGAWESDGQLAVHGRADHMLKHPNGEKVPAATIEQELMGLRGIAQVVVAVDDARQGLVGLVWADAPAAAEASALVARNAETPVPWWRIRTLALLGDEPTVANGLLTPSHKLRRQAVIDRWRLWRAAGGDAFVERRL